MKFRRIAAAVYYFTIIWWYGNRLPDSPEHWDHPAGNLCVAMGLMTSDGTPLEKEYAVWPRS